MLKLTTSAETRLLIDNSGHVGIGIDSVDELATNYLLSVRGRVICEELRVELQPNWPDYVFSDDYPLLSLGELKSYIEQNKHLPGIPSAIEVSQSGIHVGEMQSKLLEKVEESLLYIIQLQEEIEQLRSEINTLKNQ